MPESKKNIYIYISIHRPMGYKLFFVKHIVRYSIKMYQNVEPAFVGQLVDTEAPCVALALESKWLQERCLGGAWFRRSKDTVQDGTGIPPRCGHQSTMHFSESLRAATSQPWHTETRATSASHHLHEYPPSRYQVLLLKH